MSRRAALAQVLAGWRKNGRPDPIDRGVPIDEAMALVYPEPADG